MKSASFKDQILLGIPDELPPLPLYDTSVSHAPRRKDLLTPAEKKLAVENALRYFHPRHHTTLAPEFYNELQKFGRIYMFRFRPSYAMYARPIDEYPHQCL